MLIEEFSFGNFRSFKDIQTLRMSAAKIKSSNKKLDTQNVLSVNDKTKLLKSKVIYGANASGKSNVIKAFLYFRHLICACTKDEQSLVVMSSFKYSIETENNPCFFQLIFHFNGKKYRYGFEVSDQQICNEWLYMTHDIREIPVFIREGQKISKISKMHMPKAYEISNLKTKLFTEKVLFLSLVETFGDKLAENLLDAISSVLICTPDTGILTIAVESLKNNKKLIPDVINFLKYADTNINNIKLAEIKNDTDPSNGDDTIVISIHPKYNENLEEVSSANMLFDYAESEGTKQMFALSPLIIEALNNGQPIIIDEFGSQLHPLLTKKIFSLFNSENNNSSQIIAATHTTELMSSDLLRKDQIDFVEKDTYGRSYLYTLVEIKGIRNTASFEDDYFKGKYGAIPFLGNWEELEKICNKTTETQDEP